MHKSFAKSFYRKAPNVIKDLIGIVVRNTPNRYRPTPTREEVGYYRYLKNTERLSAERLLEIQRGKLRRLIVHAYNHVPYYRSVFTKRHLRPEDIETVDDLRQLPLLTKSLLRENENSLITEGLQKADLKVKTSSGSTGTPTRVYVNDHMVGVKRAHFWRWSQYAGVDPYKDKMVYVGGAPRDWNGNPDDFRGVVHVSRRSMFVSSFNMNPRALRMYLEDIERFKPDYIRGYSSGIYTLARYLCDKRKTYPLKAVMCSSDALLPQQRETIRQAFACRVCEHYAMAEEVISGSDCEKEVGIHINMESCIAETIDANGHVCIGRPGRLIGTCLENLAMPLIRYETGDIGTLLDPTEKCLCGRSHQRLVNIEGREMDMIVTPEGQRVGTQFDIMLGSVHEAIFECQYVQESLHHLVINVVPGKTWDSSLHAHLLTDNIRKHVGRAMRVDIVTTDKIQRKPNGKFPFLVSKLSEQEKQAAMSS